MTLTWNHSTWSQAGSDVCNIDKWSLFENVTRLFNHRQITRDFRVAALANVQGKSNQLKRVRCPSNKKSAGKAALFPFGFFENRRGKEKSSGVILWNRRQHTYLVLIHFACAELWMSNNYAHRALNREGRGTFEWGSISVARAEKRVLNSKHRAIMCLMNKIAKILSH